MYGMRVSSKRGWADRPQKAMKRWRYRSIVGRVASGATLCDFGEVETVSKLDVERIECTDECAPARVARDGAYLSSIYLWCVPPLPQEEDDHAGESVRSRD
jgi:hypothetical protein